MAPAVATAVEAASATVDAGSREGKLRPYGPELFY